MKYSLSFIEIVVSVLEKLHTQITNLLTTMLRLRNLIENRLTHLIQIYHFLYNS